MFSLNSTTVKFDDGGGTKTPLPRRALRIDSTDNQLGQPMISLDTEAACEGTSRHLDYTSATSADTTLAIYLRTDNFYVFVSPSAAPSRFFLTRFLVPPIVRRIVRHIAASVFVFIGIYASNNSAAACNAVWIDNVWTGTRVSFSGIAFHDHALIFYYNPDRQLTVARLEYKSCEVSERSQIGDVFSGWDSHNGIVSTVDEYQGLHVSGDMHDSPLKYFYSPQEQKLSDLKRRPMTGLNERRITYPSFVRLPSGLIFFYREGGSGQGAWYANFYGSDQKWRKLGYSPVFSDKDESNRQVSAYPSRFEIADDGSLHTTVVWRHSSNVSSNFALSYYRTKDFVKWFDADGKQLLAPLQPTTATAVDITGEERGLLNNQKINLTADGNPVIIYHKFAASGLNAVFIAYRREGRWATQNIAEASARTEIKGGGSLAQVPRFSEIDFASSPPHLIVQFPGETARKVALPMLSSKPTLKIPPKFAPRPPDNTKLESKVLGSAVLTSGDKSNAGAIELQWTAQAPNGDKPRLCTSYAPTACRPEATALWALFSR